MFLSEYTDYDFNDGLSCSKAENIFEIQTSHEEYASFGFVEQTTLFQNFTNNWEVQEGRAAHDAISEWKLCTNHAEHAIQLAAFYMLNYNCFYNKNPVKPDTKLTEIECNFQKNWWRNNSTHNSDVPESEVTSDAQADVFTLFDIFEGKELAEDGHNYDCFK